MGSNSCVQCKSWTWSRTACSREWSTNIHSGDYLSPLRCFRSIQVLVLNACKQSLSFIFKRAPSYEIWSFIVCEGDASFSSSMFIFFKLLLLTRMFNPPTFLFHKCSLYMLSSWLTNALICNLSSDISEIIISLK